MQKNMIKKILNKILKKFCKILIASCVLANFFANSARILNRNVSYISHSNISCWNISYWKHHIPLINIRSCSQNNSPTDTSSTNNSSIGSSQEQSARKQRKVKFIQVQNNDEQQIDTVPTISGNSFIFHAINYEEAPAAPNYCDKQSHAKSLEDELAKLIELSLEEEKNEPDENKSNENALNEAKIERAKEIAILKEKQAKLKATNILNQNFSNQKLKKFTITASTPKTPPALSTFTNRYDKQKHPNVISMHYSPTSNTIVANLSSEQENLSNINVLQSIPLPPISLKKLATQNKLSKETSIENLSTPKLSIPKLPITKNPKYTQKMEKKRNEITYFPLLSFHQNFTPICVIDIEATGLANNDKATEIGMLIIENWQITGEKYHTLLNPEKEVRPSAYHLTGYTLKFLSGYPKFIDIREKFLRSIKNYPLLFHHASYDLKLLNDGLSYTNQEDKLENKHVIIDTLPWIQHVYSEKKRHNLKSFCEYEDVKLGEKSFHNALNDAELLAECTISLFKNTNEFCAKINWNNLQLFDFYEHFSEISANNDSLSFFQKLGMIRNFPKHIRYSRNLYNPKLSRHSPALLFPFVNQFNEFVGVLVKYYESEIKKENWLYDKISLSHVYGMIDNAYINLHEDTKEIIFFGNLASSLSIQALLFGNNISIINNLKLNNNFSIFALLDIMHLKNIQIPLETQEIYLLLDYNNNHQEEIRNMLEGFVEKYCNYNFCGFFQLIDENINLKGFIVKYKTKDWDIDEDYVKNKKRIFQISAYPNLLTKITYNIESKLVMFQEEIIFDPHTHILIAHPALRIKAVVLRTKFEHNKPIWAMLKENSDEIEQKLHRAIILKKKKDIDYIEKNELARSIYENALLLTETSAPSLYLQKRSIDGPYPACFRYAENIYHPWLQEKFPALLVPLFDQNKTLVGINRIFCKQDGTPLPRKYPKEGHEKKIPTKLSIGLTVGAATEIYASSVDNTEITSMQAHPVIFISEGTENALIAANTMKFIAKHNQELAKKIYQTLRVTNTFAIKACVGINGIIDTPLDKITNTVIILADPDFDIDAKRTMRLTVQSFLQRNLKTKIVVPNYAQFKIMDLNDIYVATKNYETIGQIMCDATEIFNINELGNDFEPIQMSVLNIKNTRNTPFMATMPVETKSITEKSTIEELVTKKPVEQKSISENSAAEKSVAQQPASKNSISEISITQQLPAEQPVIAQFSIEKHVIEKSVIETPILETNVTESITQQPLIAQPPVTKPITEQTKLEIEHQNATAINTTQPETAHISETIDKNTIIEEFIFEKPIISQPSVTKPIIEQMKLETEHQNATQAAIINTMQPETKSQKRNLDKKEIIDKNSALGFLLSDTLTSIKNFKKR